MPRNEAIKKLCLGKYSNIYNNKLPKNEKALTM